MIGRRLRFVDGSATARRALLAALGLGLAAGGVTALLVSGERSTYTASAQVGFSTPTVPTQATVALTPATATDALRRSGMGGMSARTLISRTTIAVAAAGSGVVVIRVADQTPEVARRLADAYAQAFVTSRRRQ